MPIRPENKARYPKDWKSIVEQVRARSGNRCEGSPAFPDCRAPNGEPHPVTGSKVVLTTGHLDHVPENCGLDNLRHWWQRRNGWPVFAGRILQPWKTIAHSAPTSPSESLAMRERSGC